MSMTHFTCIVVMTNMKIIFMGRSLNIFTLLIALVCIVLLHCFTWAIAEAFKDGAHDVAIMLFRSPTFYLINGVMILL